MGWLGPEQPQSPPGNMGVASEGGAQCGALAPNSAPSLTPVSADPDLAAVIAAWSDLPPAIRAGIVAMVRATGTAHRQLGG